MKLAILGSNGWYPNENRQTNCFAIPEHNIVLDAGTGFYRIAKHGHDKRIAHTIISLSR